MKKIEILIYDKEEFNSDTEKYLIRGLHDSYWSNNINEVLDIIKTNLTQYIEFDVIIKKPYNKKKEIRYAKKKNNNIKKAQGLISEEKIDLTIYFLNNDKLNFIHIGNFINLILTRESKLTFNLTKLYNEHNTSCNSIINTLCKIYKKFNET